MAPTRSPVTTRSTLVESDHAHHGEDLTQIRGIGPTIARRLNAAGISTYTRLAELSSIEIANQVPGLSAKRITHEAWIRQARKLAASRQGGRRSGRTTKARQRGQSYATFTVELLMNEDRSVRRTQATYIQENVEEKWVGWEATRLVSFMTQCAAISFPSPGFSQSSQLDSPAKMALPAGPFLASNSAVQSACCPEIESTPIPELDDSPPILGIDPGSETGETMSGMLHLSELVTTVPGTDVPQHAVSAGKKFNCRLGLDLTDMTCIQHGPAIYTVTIWAKKLGNKQRQVVGEGQGAFTRADKTICTVEVTLASEGVYRLEAIVTLTQPVASLLPPGRWLAMQRGGWLQVY